jgi:hypothetical protein
MAERPPRADLTPLVDPPSEVTVTVIGDGRPSPLRAAGPVLTVVAAAVVLLLAATSGGPAPRSDAPGRRIAIRVAPPTTQSPAGMDAIETVFRNSLQCMTLTFAPSESSYFSATPRRACSHPVSDRVEVFRQVGNQLRIVLGGAGKACAGAPIPPLVQVELGVCQGSAASLYPTRPPPSDRIGPNPQGGALRAQDARGGTAPTT